jgi:hypothetical protein
VLLRRIKRGKGEEVQRRVVIGGGIGEVVEDDWTDAVDKNRLGDVIAIPSSAACAA